ncbi:MAG: histidinol dehydrogenase [Bacteroidetes bacterium]|nr:histidinol dehydrogenase [Bacteroidota bacterium]MCY4204794.1 histidinol dehydrogenase [Bacteroidota bacterium]
MIRLIAPDQWKRKPVSLDSTLEARVAEVIKGVIDHGDEALLEYTKTLDRVDLTSLSVPASVLSSAWDEARPAWKRAFESAAENIRRFHWKQLQQSWYIDDGDGVRLGQRILPVESAGMYVPGGTAGYPSSVLMTAIPAQVAGVANLYLTSPPDVSTGFPHQEIMAAAHMLHINNVYSVGGAQAIAALAFGTESIPAVDKIVGPGNAYVTAAKKQVFGHVDIDSLAGPSELVVLADKTAKPEWIAHDLMAQAEHDVMASAILVTPDEEIAKKTCRELNKLLSVIEREEIAGPALRKYGAAIVTPSMDDAIYMVNKIAPEHLELMVADAWVILERIRHAGAVFIGPWSPEAVGDYYAGPNHVLPTGGTARFSSALGVEDFIRRQSVIGYSQRRLSLVADEIALMANSERLDAHARSIKVRTNN